LRVAGLIILGVVSLFFCFIFGAFYANTTREPDHTMPPDLEARAAAMFVDFQNKRVAARTTLNILGDRDREVAIVGSFDAGVAGFMRIPTSVHVFYVVGDGFKAFRFNNECVFVIIKGSYNPALGREVREEEEKRVIRGDQTP
jgi:hypothetical protein